MSNFITLELPYPHAKLNPNKPCHWRVKSKLVKKYRADCCILAKQVKPMRAFRVEFFPPHNRPTRNIDNAIASMKAGFDGLQDAWGIDDCKFKITYPTEFSDVVKGGKVIIISQGDNHGI